MKISMGFVVLSLSFFSSFISPKLRAEIRGDRDLPKIEFDDSDEFDLKEDDGFRWHYQALRPEGNDIIKKVLASEGGDRIIKVHSLKRSRSLSLEEVDAILFDVGFFEVLKNADALKRELLLKYAQKGSLKNLLRRYPRLSKKKLKSLVALFR